MPIYEYQCELCGHALEQLQKMSDPELTECPACHAPGLRKLVSAAGFQLKGNGWYVTDFRGNKSGGEAKKAGSDTAVEAPNTKPAAEATTTATPAAATGTAKDKSAGE